MANKRRAKTEVQTQVETVVGQGFGWCRANQHIWENPKNTQLELLDKGRTLKVTFHCPNCTSDRVDYVDLRTGNVDRVYHYVDGYTVKIKGRSGKRPTKSDWRRAHYADLVKKVKKVKP